MNMKLKQPFSTMYENYSLSENTSDKIDIGEHWDVFNSDFKKIIARTEFWPNFLRNSISIGFNDNLMNFSNARTNQNSNFSNGWDLRDKFDFKDLISENIIDAEENKKNLNFLNSLFGLCGLDFVLKNIQSNVGSPAKTFFKIDPKKNKNYSNKNYFCNNHDLSDIYYFFIICNYLKKLLSTKPITLLEIGSGYGGLISKIKHNYKGIKCIIIDLPEVLAVQNYYLSQEFPNSKFLFLTDLKKDGEKIFNYEFDFLLLPYWEIIRIPNKSLDLIINIRSMMEMTKEMIKYYFTNIHRIIKDKGNFVCINRYEKYETKIREYPFDLKWKIIHSEQSKIQKHIHELILKIDNESNNFSINKIISDVSG